MSASMLETTVQAAPARRSINKARLIGRILTGIALAFLTFDTVFKLVGATSDSTIRSSLTFCFRPIWAR